MTQPTIRWKPEDVDKLPEKEYFYNRRPRIDLNQFQVERTLRDKLYSYPWTQTNEEREEYIKERQKVSFSQNPKEWFYWNWEVPLWRASDTIEKRRSAEQLTTIGSLLTPEMKPFQEMTPLEQGLTVGLDVAAAALPYTKQIFQMTKDVAVRTGSKAFQEALNTGIDRWIASQGRLLNADRSALGKIVVNDREWLVEKATNNYVRRLAERRGTQTAIQSAVDDTITEMQPRMLRQVSRSGIQMGGKSAEGVPPPGELPPAKITPAIREKLHKLGWTDDLIKTQLTDKLELKAALEGKVNMELYGIKPTTPTETQMTLPEFNENYMKAVENYNTALTRISMGDEPVPMPVPKPIADANPALDKLMVKIKESETVLPEQKLITHEERAARINNALPELGTGEGEEPFIRFMSKLQGEIPKADFMPVADELTQTEWDAIYEMARTSAEIHGYEYARLASGLNKIKQGVLPVESELEILQKVYGTAFTDTLVSKMSLSKARILLDLLNAPRSSLASFDMSGLLRQGGLIVTRNPIEGMKTIEPMVKSFFSDANAELVDSIIRRRPHFALWEEMGGYHSPLPSAEFVSMNRMEEAFMSRLIDKFPVLGPIVRASNRAYVTVLNDLKSRYWEMLAPQWLEAGATDLDLRELAKFINAASGRGHAGWLERYAPFLNTFLFSPRLLISRPQIIYTALASPSKRVRVEALRTIIQGLGTGIAILGLAKLAGADIESDPRSADFGKIRKGNTRLDIWTGYLQWLRFLAHISTGQKKNTETGEIYEKNRFEAVIDFTKSKTSPPAGLLADLLNGKDYARNPVPPETPDQWTDQVWNRLVPLFIQDMVDAYNVDSWQGIGITWPAFFGVGVTAYEPRYDNNQVPNYLGTSEGTSGVTPTDNRQRLQDALSK